MGILVLYGSCAHDSFASDKELVDALQRQGFLIRSGPDGHLLEVKSDVGSIGANLSRATVERLSRCVKLGRIDLASANIGDSQLAAVRGFSELMDLDLSSTSVTSKGLEAFCMCKKLRSLSLENTGVDHVGIRRLRKLPIESLFVSGLNIDDHALEAISTITSLKLLGVGGPEISDDGVVTLARLEKLKVLHITAPGVSHAAFRQLEAALPHCRVVVSKESGSPFTR